MSGQRRDNVGMTATHIYMYMSLLTSARRAKARQSMEHDYQMAEKLIFSRVWGKKQNTKQRGAESD